MEPNNQAPNSLIKHEDLYGSYPPGMTHGAMGPPIGQGGGMLPPGPGGQIPLH